MEILMSETVQKEVSESGVLTLRMNRPDVLNSLNSDLVFTLIDILKDAAEDDAVRAIVLTGNGRGFCAGADLAGGNWPSEEGMSPGDITANSMEIGFNPLLRAVVDSPKPVVTAINGMAAGGGVGLALSGDLVLAAESAKFRLVFAPQLGIIPDVGASWLVPNLVGRARANGMALLGDNLDRRQGVGMGHGVGSPSGRRIGRQSPGICRAHGAGLHHRHQSDGARAR
jgi:2-(1,2-epoxy-1,2-dihydrophenyl)acetyl-CoA isomerase